MKDLSARLQLTCRVAGLLPGTDTGVHGTLIPERESQPQIYPHFGPEHSSSWGRGLSRAFRTLSSIPGFHAVNAILNPSTSNMSPDTASWPLEGGIIPA